MSNPFVNATLRDWFLDCFDLVEIPIHNVVLTGSGPFDCNEFKKFLTAKNFNVCNPVHGISTVIVGNHGWDKNVILKMYQLNSKISLQFYSQEMFFAYMLTAQNPHDCKPTIIEKLTKSHTFFSYFNSSSFESDLSNINNPTMNIPKIGFLRHLGYKVGNNGLGATERRWKLRQAYEISVPTIFSTDYINEWGDPKSSKRLEKIAKSLWGFHNKASISNKIINMETSLADWKSDHNWLKNELYIRNNYRFPWPEIA